MIFLHSHRYNDNEPFTTVQFTFIKIALYLCHFTHGLKTRQSFRRKEKKKKISLPVAIRFGPVNLSTSRRPKTRSPYQKTVPSFASFQRHRTTFPRKNEYTNILPSPPSVRMHPRIVVPKRTNSGSFVILIRRLWIILTTVLPRALLDNVDQSLQSRRMRNLQDHVCLLQDQKPVVRIARRQVMSGYHVPPPCCVRRKNL